MSEIKKWDEDHPLTHRWGQSEQVEDEVRRYAAETLTDHDWNMLDDLCMVLGVGAGDPPGGWFNILPDHIRAIESLMERLGRR